MLSPRSQWSGTPERGALPVGHRPNFPFQAQGKRLSAIGFVTWPVGDHRGSRVLQQGKRGAPN